MSGKNFNRKKTSSFLCPFQNYVHRSGRTARALKEGLSVMLIGPEDQQYYKRIVKTLNRGKQDTLSFG